MISSLVSASILFMNDIQEAKEKNKEFIQIAKKKYWDACNYPRKIKKKMRKEALSEIDFRLKLEYYGDNLFSY
jgi:alpha-galactosidase/6-phospho-beta-glucosidase family protein